MLQLQHYDVFITSVIYCFPVLDKGFSVAMIQAFDLSHELIRRLEKTL